MLSSLHGDAPIEATEITIDFEPDVARGSAGCNGYGVEYTASTDWSIAFGTFEITAEGCTEPEGVMAQEQDYTAALRGAVAYASDGEALELSNAAGEITLVFVVRSA